MFVLGDVVAVIGRDATLYASEICLARVPCARAGTRLRGCLRGGGMGKTGEEELVEKLSDCTGVGLALAASRAACARAVIDCLAGGESVKGSTCRIVLMALGLCGFVACFAIDAERGI